MALKQKRNGVEEWTIVSTDGSARASFVPAYGGIGSSLVMPTASGPRELLYQHDFFWDPAAERTRGGWPFLFPVCGRLERDGVMGDYLYEGRRRRLPSHGFSLRVPWTAVSGPTDDTLLMHLADTPATLEVFPFAFQVVLVYRIAAGELICELTVHNRSERPMPYYAGYHPYFLTPPPGAGKEEVQVEISPDRLYVYNPRLTDIVDATEPLVFPVPVTDPVINESLNRVPSGNVSRLQYPDGCTVNLRVDSPGAPDLFPFVQLYTIPEKPFFCIEPWMGHPNGLNSVDGVRWLSPDAEDKSVLRLWITEGSRES